MKTKVDDYIKDKNCSRAEAMKALGYDVDKSDETKVEVTEKSEEVNPLASEVETLKAENEMLRKGLIDNGYTITADTIEKKVEVEMIDIEGEMVVKSDIPAPVLKALETARLEKADIALTKSAEEALPHFDLAVAKSLVEKFAEEEKIMEALKACDASIGASMEEFGESNVDGEFANATSQMDSLVKSHMKENNLKQSEFAKAYAVVAKTDEGKSLINKTYKGE